MLRCASSRPDPRRRPGRPGPGAAALRPASSIPRGRETGSPRMRRPPARRGRVRGLESVGLAAGRKRKDDRKAGARYHLGTPPSGAHPPHPLRSPGYAHRTGPPPLAMRIAKRIEKGSYAHKPRLPAPAKTGQILETPEKSRPAPPTPQRKERPQIRLGLVHSFIHSLSSRRSP